MSHQGLGFEVRFKRRLFSPDELIKFSRYKGLRIPEGLTLAQRLERREDPLVVHASIWGICPELERMLIDGDNRIELELFLEEIHGE